MVVLRNLSSDEIPTAVQLWVDVFGMEAAFFQTLLDGGEPDDFSLGAFEGDRLVSSVHVFMRRYRNLYGQPLKVGGIGSVSTLPEARRQGHSLQLLQMSLDQMAERRCIWSYLVTGVNDHYARHGWRTVSTPLFRGTIKESNWAEPIEASEVTTALLDDMASVHESSLRNTPMANARSKSMWDNAIRYRISGANDAVFTYYRGNELFAYLVCRRNDDTLDLIEGTCRNGAGQDLKELVRKRLALAAKEGFRKVAWLMPEASEAFPALVTACDEVFPGEDRSWMLRPIADRIPWMNLLAIHTDPRGRRSELDNF